MRRIVDYGSVTPELRGLGWRVAGRLAGRVVGGGRAVVIYDRLLAAAALLHPDGDLYPLYWQNSNLKTRFIQMLSMKIFGSLLFNHFMKFFQSNFEYAISNQTKWNSHYFNLILNKKLNIFVLSKLVLTFGCSHLSLSFNFFQRLAIDSDKLFRSNSGCFPNYFDSIYCIFKRSVNPCYYGIFEIQISI